MVKFPMFHGFTGLTPEIFPRTLGVCIPIYRGALGFLPLRKPVHLVLGAPLELPALKTAGQPTEEELQRAHGKYVEALKLGDWRWLEMNFFV